MANESMAVTAVNNLAARGEESYVSKPLNISSTNDETRNVISSTFSVIKNNLYNALQNAVGLGDTVSISYLRQDPNNGIRVGDKILQPYTGVGIMQPYNELGNSSCGVYSLHTIG